MGHSKHNILAKTFINFYKIKLLMKVKGVSFKKKKISRVAKKLTVLKQFSSS